MDYVKKESRGKAAAVQALGLLLGEAFAMVVLFGYSKRENVSQEQAFRMAACVILGLTIITLFLVQNPKSKQTKIVSKDPATEDDINFSQSEIEN